MKPDGSERVGFQERAMYKLFVSLGAISGGLAVILGAFATHNLRGTLDPSAIALMETGVRYQMIHALALIAVGILCLQRKEPTLALKVAGISFLMGTVLFAGSLYVLAFQNLFWVGLMTPIGGLALIVGWVCLAIAPWQQL
jgi:uncharacterized membrane protein YgdD (TMEM256/DUF423 family)